MSGAGKPYIIEAPTYRGATEIYVAAGETGTTEAAIAEKLIAHFGVVAGESDGEDTAGRQKLRLMTPNELVTRCFEIADAFCTGARERGWLIPLPAPKEPSEKSQ